MPAHKSPEAPVPAHTSNTKTVLPYYTEMGCLAWMQCLTSSCTSAAEIVTWQRPGMPQSPPATVCGSQNMLTLALSLFLAVGHSSSQTACD